VRTSIVKRLLLFGAVVAALMCVAPQHVSAASGATSRFQPALGQFALSPRVVMGRSDRIPDDMLSYMSNGPVAMWSVSRVEQSNSANGTYGVWTYPTDAQERAGVAALNNSDAGSTLTIARRVGSDEWIRGDAGAWGLTVQGEVSYRNVGFVASYHATSPSGQKDLTRAQAWVERALAALVDRARRIDRSAR
jgi:hypothetical protein